MSERIRSWRRCPHASIRGIYGDEINHSAGYRLECEDCGRLLDGPVSLATAAHDAEVEARVRGEVAAAIRRRAGAGNAFRDTVLERAARIAEGRES